MHYVLKKNGAPRLADRTKPAILDSKIREMLDQGDSIHAITHQYSVGVTRIRRIRDGIAAAEVAS